MDEAKTITITHSAEDWIKRISCYERDFEKWEKRAEKIVKRYKAEEADNTSNLTAKRFNILWSNVQTLVPAVFARLPQPDVSRRYKDNDPVGRVAALILERALEYEIQHYTDYAEAMGACVLDRFLGGRGTSWVRFEPHLIAIPKNENPDGIQVTEDQGTEKEPEAAEYIEQIEYECSPCDYVHWRDFGHTPARTWEEVTAVWRRVFMDREALLERFGDKLGAEIPLDTMPEELKNDSGKTTAEKEKGNQAIIYEIWDKATSKVIWISKSKTEVLDERDDPLQLEGFWPCPKPLYATLANDKLIPTPDFALYQDQAATLDTLSDRIHGLVEMLQVKGCYDNATPELARLFSEAQNGSLIPVQNWAAFAEKAGLKGAISLVELQPIFQALQAAYQAVEEQKSQIYEITGLSDIMRGQSDPRETLGAQELKGQFGSMRLRAMQCDVARFASDLLRIKAQIICKQYQPESLAKLGGVETLNPADRELVGPAIQLLKDNMMRCLRIEITSDSMIQMNEAKEKADRVEFLKAVSAYLKEAVPAASSNPTIAPMLIELFKFGVAGFKVGKTVEGAIDQVADQLAEAAKNPQPKPDPEQMKMQAQMQMQQQDLQAKGMLEERKMQLEAERDARKAQNDMQERQHDAELRTQFEAKKMEFEQWRAERQFQIDMVKFEQELAFKREMAALDRQARMQAEAQEPEENEGMVA